MKRSLRFTSSLSIIFCLFFLMNCQKKPSLTPTNPNNPPGGVGANSPASIQGKVKIPSTLTNATDLVVSSFASTSKVNSDLSFSIDLPDSQKLGVVFLNDQKTGNLIAMGYVKPGDKQFELNSQSTAIALLMMNPTFTDLGEPYKQEAIDYLKKHPQINEVVAEIEKINLQKEDLFSEKNTALFKSMNRLSVFFITLRIGADNQNARFAAEKIHKISIKVQDQHSIVIRNEGSWTNHTVALYDINDNFLESYNLPGLIAKSNSFKGIGYAASYMTTSFISDSYNCLKSIDFNSTSSVLCPSSKAALFTLQIPPPLSITLGTKNIVKVRITNGLYGDDRPEITYSKSTVAFGNATKEDSLAFGRNFSSLLDYSFSIMGLSFSSDLSNLAKCISDLNLGNIHERFVKAGSAYYRNFKYSSKMYENLNYIMSEGCANLLSAIDKSSSGCSSKEGAKIVLKNIVNASKILKQLEDFDHDGAGPNFMMLHYDLHNPFYGELPGFSATVTSETNNLKLGGEPPKLKGIWSGRVTDKNGNVEAIHFELSSVYDYRTRPKKIGNLQCVLCVGNSRAESDGFNSTIGERYTNFVGGYNLKSKNPCFGEGCLMENRVGDLKRVFALTIRANGEIVGEDVIGDDRDYYVGKYRADGDIIKLFTQTGKTLTLSRF